MLFSTLISLLAASTAAPCEGHGDGSFGLITIHSGSQYQNAAVKISSDGHFSINGEKDLTLKIDGDFLEANGAHAQVKYGYLSVDQYTWGTLQPKNDNGDLSINGNTAFYVCPSNNNNIAFGQYGPPSDCKDGVSVALHIVEGQ